MNTEQEEERSLPLRLATGDTATTLEDSETSTWINNNGGIEEDRKFVEREFKRMGFDRDARWRISDINKDFELCNTYPRFLIVPSTFTDEDLESVAKFRYFRRIPTAVWRHTKNGCFIVRSSQPTVGWFGWFRSELDENLVQDYVNNTIQHSQEHERQLAHVSGTCVSEQSNDNNNHRDQKDADANHNGRLTETVTDASDPPCNDNGTPEGKCKPLNGDILNGRGGQNGSGILNGRLSGSNGHSENNRKLSTTGSNNDLSQSDAPASEEKPNRLIDEATTTTATTTTHPSIAIDNNTAKNRASNDVRSLSDGLAGHVRLSEDSPLLQTPPPDGEHQDIFSLCNGHASVAESNNNNSKTAVQSLASNLTNTSDISTATISADNASTTSSPSTPAANTPITTTGVANNTNTASTPTSTCPSATNTSKMLIIDARSYAAAMANRAKGGGCECSEYYQRCEVHFMNLANIHSIRKSYHAIRSVCEAYSEQSNNWVSFLDNSRWLHHISGLLRSALLVVDAIDSEEKSILIHCSDGWDRTPQLVALAEIMLDPHYRTFDGFRGLIQREWLDFGHKFADRCGSNPCNEDPNERCPVFLQWLDCVQQLLVQYPKHFEFNSLYLDKLNRHTYSNTFGTFSYNCTQERILSRIDERMGSLWSYFDSAREKYRNQAYMKSDDILRPSFKVKDLHFWKEVYLPPVNQPKANNQIPFVPVTTTSTTTTTINNTAPANNLDSNLFQSRP